MNLITIEGKITSTPLSLSPLFDRKGYFVYRFTMTSTLRNSANEYFFTNFEITGRTIKKEIKNFIKIGKMVRVTGYLTEHKKTLDPIGLYILVMDDEIEIIKNKNET